MTKTPKVKTSKTDIFQTKNIDNQMQKEIQKIDHVPISKSKTTTVGDKNKQPSEKTQSKYVQ